MTDLTPAREKEIRDPDRPMFSAEYAQGVIDELVAALDAERARAEQAIREADGMARAPYGEFAAMRERMEAAEARSRDPRHALRVLANECMESGLEIGELVEGIRSQVLAPEPALSSKGRTTAFEAENPGSSPGGADTGRVAYEGQQVSAVLPGPIGDDGLTIRPEHIANLEAVAEAARRYKALLGSDAGLHEIEDARLALDAALAVLEEPPA